MNGQAITRIAVLLTVGFLLRPMSSQEPQNPPAESSPQTPSSDVTKSSPQANTPADSGPKPDAATETAPEHPRLKRKPKKSAHSQKPQSSAITQKQNQSGKVVVRNGGASDKTPEMSLGMSQEQAQHQKETTAQLLATTDANVKRVAGHQLTPNQQSMLDQINTYTRQSRAASDAGDVNRAHTLAYKAHLLSDELVRP